MNTGNLAAIIILVGGFILIMIYTIRRMRKEVKIIDNISYPKHDTRNRSTASTTSNDSSRTAKDIGVKGEIKTRRGIQILNNSSGARGESIKRKSSNSIELHKPTAL